MAHSSSIFPLFSFFAVVISIFVLHAHALPTVFEKRSPTSHSLNAPRSRSASPIPVEIITVNKDEIIQIPKPPSQIPDPKILGFISNVLEIIRRPSINPFPIGDPEEFEDLDENPLDDITPETYSKDFVLNAEIDSLEKRWTDLKEWEENTFKAEDRGKGTEVDSLEKRWTDLKEWEENTFKAEDRGKGTEVAEVGKRETGSLNSHGIRKRWENNMHWEPSTFNDKDRKPVSKRREHLEDIFTPIATNGPSQLFGRRSTHPVPKKSIATSGPIQTNKFYANLFLGKQNGPVFTLPYQLWWSNQPNDTIWGMGISQPEPELRQFGPPNGPNGASESYVSPIYIRHLSFSAMEFSRNVSSMELTNPSTQSVTVTFFANNRTRATAATTKSGVMKMPLCLGMGFVSAEYYHLTPVFDSSVFIRELRSLPSPRVGIIKYRMLLEDESIWVLYAHHSSLLEAKANPFALRFISNGRLEAINGPFTGLIQIAKVPRTEVEAVLDATTGSYCNGVSVSGQVSDSTGRYQMNFERAGPGFSELLMYALPHHIKSLEQPTTNQVKSALRLSSPTKGMMTGIISDQWRLVEEALPVNIGYLPVKKTGSVVFSVAHLQRLSLVARKEVMQDFNNQTNLDSMYFSGKALAKFAYVCLTINEVLQDTILARICLNKLKPAFAVFAENKQKYKLVYEESWKGVVSETAYLLPDPYSDFGNGHYNDHHFHYSYFIQTAAIIAQLDKKLLGTTSTWLASNKEYVNTLVRDVANPSLEDPYFPVSRAFDWYHGHSWAKGLFESPDGKDEESSSEDYNFAYSMKLWGHASGDRAMEARGNLMLGIMKNSMNEYILLSSGNRNQPESFIDNKVTGILWETKVNHTTYFGTKPEYIQGIHMLPLTPISPYIRSVDFCIEEWNLYFTGNKTAGINDGWKGILYANMAIFDPRRSWDFFAQSGFNNTWLDGGASRTWYLAFAGALGGAS